VIEVTQSGVLTNLDDPDARVPEEHAKELAGFGKCQAFFVREVSGRQRSRLHRIAIEMKKYGSRCWSQLQRVLSGLPWASSPYLSK
jgi:hypothetical protein